MKCHTTQHKENKKGNICAQTPSSMHPTEFNIGKLKKKRQQFPMIYTSESNIEETLLQSFWDLKSECFDGTGCFLFKSRRPLPMIKAKKKPWLRCDGIYNFSSIECVPTLCSVTAELFYRESTLFRWTVPQEIDTFSVIFIFD